MSPNAFPPLAAFFPLPAFSFPPLAFSYPLPNAASHPPFAFPPLLLLTLLSLELLELIMLLLRELALALLTQKVLHLSKATMCHLFQVAHPLVCLPGLRHNMSSDIHRQWFAFK